MLQLFDIKKGDKFSFTITFKNLTEDLTTLDFGVKMNYMDTTRLITKSLGNGVTKIADGKYEVDLSSTETDSLSPNIYVYDLRLSIGDIVYTPLYGFLNIQETVFD